MEFKYVAISADGQKQLGCCQAVNKEQAQVKLQQAGLHLLSCRPNYLSYFTIKPKVGADFVVEFSRQMAVLLSSGLSLHQALLLLQQEQQKASEKAVVTALLTSVQQGQSLLLSLASANGQFNKDYCDVIEIGEKTGRLEQAFRQNAEYLFGQKKLAKQLRQALTYPVIVLLVALAVIVILLLKVLPSFESLFQSFEQSLPYPTQIVLSVSHYLQSNWLYILAGASLAVVIYLLTRKTALVIRTTARLKLHLPVVAKVIKLSFYTQFATSSHNLLSAGVPLHQVLNKLVNISAHPSWQRKLQQIENEVTAGNSFYSACQHSQLFPHLLLQLIKVGEESGSLELRLKNIADIYQQRLDEQIKFMVSLIEPSIMIFLGVVVGGLVLVMYLPIFTMSSFI